MIGNRSATLSPLPGPRPAAQLDEDRHIARAAAGDRAAFARLYELHRRSVLCFVQSRIHHHSDAEDITQEVFLRALGAIGRYQIRGVSVRAWLFQIAANAIVDRHRDPRRRRAIDLGTLPGRLDAGGRTPDEIVADVDAARRIWAVIAHLPDQQRTALILRVAADLPLEQVGLRMGRSEGAAKLLVHRARQAVRRRLAGAEAVA